MPCVLVFRMAMRVCKAPDCSCWFLGLEAARTAALWPAGVARLLSLATAAPHMLLQDRCPHVPPSPPRANPPLPLPPLGRALQIGDLEVHAVSYEQQQAAGDDRIAGATPGSPAAVYKQE